MYIKNICLLLLCIITLASCEKYLEKDPLDKLTSDQAFSNESNLQLYVNGFYTMLPNANQIYQSELMSDITVRKEVYPYLLTGFTPQSAIIQQAAPWTWTNLRNINYFIENNKNAGIPAATKAHYTGIARLFRAYFYYNAVRTYGDVPWYGKTLGVDDPDLYKPRDSRALVMDSVLADLDYAVANIRDTKDATSSQVTRSVALAYKSRICLFEASFRKYHNLFPTTTAKWFGEAASAADILIKGGKYTLQKTTNSDIDYRTLFTSENPVASEVILATVYNNTLRKWHGSNLWYNSLTAGDRLGLNKRFVNSYLNLNGTRYTDQAGYATQEFQQEVKNRDKRLKQTVRTPEYKRTDGTQSLPDFIVTTTGYHILKFSLDDKYFDTRTEAYNSLPIIRYGEVLLNYAEAKAELGPLSIADWNQTIGALRSRAGITNTAMPTSADAYLTANFYPGITDAVLLEVRRERAVELAAEGFRYDDLLRWKLGDNLLKPFDGIYVPAKGQILDISDNGSSGAGDIAFVDVLPPVAQRVAGVTYVVLDNTSFKLSNGSSGNLQWLSNIVRVWDQKRYLYPLPPNEIIQNPKLVQNPNW
ncbi:MAG: RagB/SusD family nutrient uptake outer membrane protein [Bacteroidota bacterium]